MASVAIVGGSEETRLLLRGLLRLYRHRIVGEAASFENFRPPTTPAERAAVVVFDLDLDDPATSGGIARLKGEDPRLRFVFLAAEKTPELQELAGSLGVHIVLHRPFAVHELIDAVEHASDGAGPPPPPPAT